MDTPGQSAVLVRWYHDDGAVVRPDEPLCALATDHATIDVPAPHAGRLRRLAAVGDAVTAGAEVARLDPI